MVRGARTGERTLRITVRPARPGDGEAMARGWIDAGRTYESLDPESFQTPDAVGLGAWFDAFLTESRSDTEATFVAEVDGRVVGFVEASIQAPFASSRRQILRELADTRLVVGALAVEEAFRRIGVGTRLMEAAEAWGRERGAHTAGVETYVASPMAMPFYEDRMGYRRRSVSFRKPLG